MLLLISGYNNIFTFKIYIINTLMVNINMLNKKNYHNYSLFLVIILLSSRFGYAQNCNPLTLDSISNPGYYIVASYTESASGLRNGPDYDGATVYYPTNATPPFASIAIVPGYISAQSTIQNWGPFLASHGIVTITIGTNSLFDDPIARKDALLDAIVSLMQENTRANSPLFGDLDINKVAVGGWSMGGGGAQLAAASDTTLKAVMALCPYLNTPQKNAASLNHPVPVLIFSGQSDGIAPPVSQADIHYNVTSQTTDKLIFEIANGNHYVANSPTGSQGFIGKIAISWLQNYLIGDSCFCPLFLNAPPTASKFLTNAACQNVTTFISEETRKKKLNFILYPNPSEGSINFEVENLDIESKYEIVSLAGIKVFNGFINKKITTIDISNYQSGIYIISVISPQFSEKIK